LSSPTLARITLRSVVKIVSFVADVTS
jgi:hypothetical protein